MEDKTFNRWVTIVFLLTFLTLGRAVTVGINHLKISDAIYAYQMDCIHNHEDWFVTYRDSESFTDSYLRVWDWSHKRILSDADYRTIKPYIGKDV